MNDIGTIRVTFTCSHCGSTNELTAAHVHQSTLVHCSRCSASVARLGELWQTPPASVRFELAVPRMTGQSPGHGADQHP